MTSTAFQQEGVIPERYSANAENLSPPLAWSGAPPGVKSFALIADDPDAPSGTWVHWVLYNLPPAATSLLEGVPTTETLQNGAHQGINSGRTVGYSGPRPPSGTHRYFFKVYALDAMLTPAKGMTKEQLLKAMDGHILAQGELMGKYTKK